MSNSRTGLSAGRPSQRTENEKSRLMASLRDTAPAEPLTRVNFELPKSLHTKLKIHVARSEHKSIREFLTEYIESLPEE
ncbi:hypothetical protein AA310_00910 [Arthrobacter sp. YC-RL1]|nr:hypothetical protein AA310_00910 [Arthrobacter sp. YC-RL1]